MEAIRRGWPPRGRSPTATQRTTTAENPQRVYGSDPWSAAARASILEAMNLLDKSPGGFIVLACFVLYSTVLVETWMLTTASLVAMSATMALIIGISAVMCRAVMRLMGSEEYILGHEHAPALVAPETVEAPPAARHRPVATGRPVLNH
jgi:hypothetical protein